MIEYDKNNPDIVYVDGKPFTRAEHERIVAEFVPPEGRNYQLLKHPSTLTAEEFEKLPPEIKQLYDDKHEPDWFRKKKN